MDKSKSRGVGRPSNYSPEIANEICERLSTGEPLAKICRDPHMPGYSTVRKWEGENDEFLALSSRARKDGTHWLADECIEIADNGEIDPQHKRIMVDTRIRLIGKWNAREYGDKLEIDATSRVAPMSGDQITTQMQQSPSFRAEIEEMLARSGRVLPG